MAEKNTNEAMYPLRLEKELLEKSKELAKGRGMSLAALIRGFLITETQAEETRNKNK
ncbi:hypothetical protein [Rufibacter immobilis]|uniref:hypothetical protein n=1 Tax=Rufibacter immobilis TaxID=1348778 RepID=UPI0035EEF3EF